MSSVTQRAAVVAAGKIAKSLGQLVTMAIAARLLPVTDYAAFGQGWTIFMFVTPLFEAGFSSAIYFFLPRLPDRQGQAAFVLRTFALLTLLGVTATAIVWFAAESVAKGFDNPALATFLRHFAPYLGLALPTLAVQATLITHRNALAMAALDVISSLGTLLAFALPLLLGHGLLKATLWLDGFAAARFAASFFYLHRKLGPAGPLPRGIIVEQLRYAAIVGVSRTVGITAKQLDRFIAGLFFAPALFAVYHTGAFELPLVGIITGAMATAMAAELSALLHDGKRSEALAIWHTATKNSALALFPLFGWLTFNTEPVIRFLFGERYVDAQWVFFIFLFALPIRVAQYGTALLADGKARQVAIGSVVALLINGALAAGLTVATKPLGDEVAILMPAVATLVAVYGHILYYQAHLARSFGCRFAAVLPLRELALILAISLVAGSIASLPRTWGADGIIYLVGSGLFAAALAYGGLFVTRLFQLQEVVELVRGFRRDRAANYPDTLGGS